MNLLPLLAALVPWARTPLGAVVAIYAACSVLSVEMQAVTVAGAGSLRGLVPLNLALSAASALWHLRRQSPAWSWVAAVRVATPWAAALALAVLVLFLNLRLPLEAADPYQMARIDQIERLGTLAYDSTADPKVNVVTGFWELMVADLRQVPVIGPWLVRLHGLAGLLLYLIALAAVDGWLPRASSPWTKVLLLVVPLAFHQFILLKNDLFLAVPSLVALAWLVGSDTEGPWRDTTRAGWLTGLVIGSKVAHAPLALMLGAGVLLRRGRGSATPLVALAAGGVLGVLCGGLLLTFFQNATYYGDILAAGPVAEMGNVNRSLPEMASGLARFLVSLIDLGQLTRVWWPGRGGWGGTWGLPGVWAVLVLVGASWRLPQARRALLFAGGAMLTFAAAFPDADISQRIVLGPELLLVAAAAHVAGRTDKAWFVGALKPVVVLSAVQVARSAVLYLWRTPVS